MAVGCKQFGYFFSAGGSVGAFKFADLQCVLVVDDILDQLITETESESESESESETSSETVTESESSSESESTSEFDTESETDTDVNQWIPENGETLPQTPVPHQLDTSSFDDLMNRLAEEMQYQNFAFP